MADTYPDPLAHADVIENPSSGDDGILYPREIFSRHRRQNETVEIRAYDFKRPERISKDQMRSLQTLHEAFARNFGASLSGFLRTIVEVRVEQAEQMTYSEFLGSLANPTCFSLINGEPLDGQFCLEISPLIVYPILDRLMGGNTKDLFVPQRPMTMIEMRLVRKILERGMQPLNDAWSAIDEFGFELGEMETNPQLVQIVPPNEVVVVIGFEVRMGGRTGTMKLCLPYNVIEPVTEDFNSQNWFVNTRDESEGTVRAMIEQGLSEASLDVEVTLAKTTITFDELRMLQVGDLITTQKPAQEPVLISVGGSPKFTGSLGHHRGSCAVRIVDSIEGEEAGLLDPRSSPSEGGSSSQSGS